MSRTRAINAWLLLSIVVASVLTLIAVPESLRVLRPFWLALVLILMLLPETRGQELEQTSQLS
mgnify:CR=1 FL=1